MDNSGSFLMGTEMDQACREGTQRLAGGPDGAPARSDKGLLLAILTCAAPVLCGMIPGSCENLL